ncbi:hypothetical protein AB5J52_21180 [Streptomyces sp. R39]|uniref:Hedgehog/Intein (Hint) domain-containing protein n=1 Tax=Streptomyces sp. R39 TaxID=3238631 RepID=A0AB39R1U1_9ACTN
MATLTRSAQGIASPPPDHQTIELTRPRTHSPTSSYHPLLPGCLLTIERDALLPLQRLQADLDETLHLGETSGTRTPARFLGDAATLVRLYTGRPADGTSYELMGAEVAELNLYG